MTYKKFYIIITSILLFSCSNDDVIRITTLNQYIANSTFETGAVIACAGNDNNNEQVQVYFYPRPNSENVKYFESAVFNAKDDYSKYTEIVLSSEPLYNGYLRFFNRNLNEEKWVIVTFEFEGEIKLSNPIRLKQLSKPSIWYETINRDDSDPQMPIFGWADKADVADAIYFQIIADATNNLLSGTYTYESNFQYYNLSNVVLNITQEPPPVLTIGNTYQFGLMGVSEDNWINFLAFESFIP